MDADDRSFENRISVQVEYFESNPSIDVVGAYELLESGEITRYPLDHETLVHHSLFYNPIGHPSLMVRRATVLDVFRYDENFVYEDYELWLRWMHKSKGLNLKFATIPEVLLRYRHHPA
jgi:hypothetical protein